MKPSRSFKSRLYVLLIVSITIPVLVLAGLLSASYNAFIEREDSLNRANMTAAVAGNMETCLDELERIAFLPYLYRDIHTYMLGLKNGHYQAPPEYMNMSSLENNYVMTFSKMMFTAKQSVSSIAFYPAAEDDDTFFIIRRNRAGLFADVQENHTDEAWHQLATRYEKAFLLQEEEGGTVLVMTQMIRDLDSKKDVGVLLIKAKADLLLDTLDDMEMRDGALLYLLDGEGNTLHLTGDAQDAPDPRDPDAVGRRYIATSAAVEAAGWRLMHLAPRADVLRMQLNTYLVAFALSLLVALVALFIYQRRSRATVASVNDILATLQSIQSGDFDARSKLDSRDELGAISGGVNQMGEQISMHIQREYQAVIDRQDAEYRALQSQINPHFLYNTLNDFVALNRMGEKEVLETAILRLTHLFRYTCSPADTVTVQEEMDFCRRYLQLRQLQLAERLQYTIEIEPDCGILFIPKLILQPLVENSVTHGMGKGKKPLHVRLRAAAENGILTLEVCDDGQGFDAQTFPEGHTGLGISNVRDRLAIFRPGATLEITMGPQGGTRCLVTIPPAQEGEAR